MTEDCRYSETSEWMQKEGRYVSFMVKCNSGWLDGCYEKKKKDCLFVWHVMSTEKGSMKKMMDFLVGKLGQDNIEFCQVISPLLMQKLKGFKPKNVYHELAKDWQVDYVGKWETGKVIGCP
jgi:hypothetical protein